MMFESDVQCCVLAVCLLEWRGGDVIEAGAVGGSTVVWSSRAMDSGVYLRYADLRSRVGTG